MGSQVTWFDIYPANPEPLHEFCAKVSGGKLQPPEGAAYAVVNRRGHVRASSPTGKKHSRPVQAGVLSEGG